MHESSTYQGILEEGRIDHAQKTLLRLGRARLGPPSDAVVKTLKSIDDLDRLDRMLDQVLQVRSWKRLLETP